MTTLHIFVKKKTMLKAYTTGDKINQEKYNDFESLVGVVFKDEGSGQVLSSASELASANAVPIEGGQVVTIWIDDSTEYNSAILTASIYAATSTIVDRAFGSWAPGVGFAQWIQIRSLQLVDTIVDSPPANPPLALVYKLVVDAYTSVVEP